MPDHAAFCQQDSENTLPMCHISEDDSDSVFLHGLPAFFYQDAAYKTSCAGIIA